MDRNEDFEQMKNVTLAIALIILNFSSLRAQHGSGRPPQPSTRTGCTMMSDTAIIWLDLTREQVWDVQQSGDRCRNACAKSDLNPFGKVDERAVVKHDKRIKSILSAMQYTEWQGIRDGIGQPR